MVTLVKAMKDGQGVQWGNAYSDEDFRVQLWPEDIKLLVHLGVAQELLNSAQERYNPDDAQRGYAIFAQPVDVILSAVKARRIDTDATRAYHGIDRAGRRLDSVGETL